MNRRHIALLASFAALLAFVAVPALAGNGKGNGNAATTGGGGGNTASIWVDASTYRSDGVLNFRDTMGFGYQVSAEYSFIQLQCSQNGVLVFSDSHAAFEGGYAYGQLFELGPSLAWSGGAAQCVGILGHRAANGRWVEDASARFDVAA